MIKKIKNKKIFYAVGIVLFVAIAVLIIVSLIPEKPKYTLADYFKKKQGEAASGNTDDIENLFTGKARKFRYKPKHGQSLTVSFELSASSLVNMNYLVAAMNVNSKGKKLDNSKGLKALYGKKQKTNVYNKGTLHIKFYKKSKKLWNVAAIIKDLTYLVNDEDSVLKKALEQPFAFSMNANGFFSNFRFMKGVPQQIRQIMQQTVYAMQVATPEKKKKVWKMKEFDSQSFYLASYVVNDINNKTKRAEITKKKIKYLTALNFEKKSTILRSLREGKKEVATSNSKISLPFSAVWIDEITTNDSDVSKAGEELSGAKESILLKHAIYTVQAPTPFPINSKNF